MLLPSCWARPSRKVRTKTAKGAPLHRARWSPGRHHARAGMLPSVSRLSSAWIRSKVPGLGQIWSSPSPVWRHPSRSVEFARLELHSAQIRASSSKARRNQAKLGRHSSLGRMRPNLAGRRADFAQLLCLFEKPLAQLMTLLKHAMLLCGKSPAALQQGMSGW